MAEIGITYNTTKMQSHWQSRWKRELYCNNRELAHRPYVWALAKHSSFQKHFFSKTGSAAQHAMQAIPTSAVPAGGTPTPGSSGDGEQRPSARNSERRTAPRTAARLRARPQMRSSSFRPYPIVPNNCYGGPNTRSPYGGHLRFHPTQATCAAPAGQPHQNAGPPATAHSPARGISTPCLLSTARPPPHMTRTANRSSPPLGPAEPDCRSAPWPPGGPAILATPRACARLWSSRKFPLPLCRLSPRDADLKRAALSTSLKGSS